MKDLLSQPHKPAVVFLKDVKFSDLKSLVDVSILFYLFKFMMQSGCNLINFF